MLGLAVLGVASLYLAGTVVTRRRGRPWRRMRTASWLLGVGTIGVVMIGPLAVAAHESFPAHMLGHLLAGMVAPLFLVAGTPVTLALRALDSRQARVLSRLLRSRPARTVAHPVTAAIINVGSLWLLYRTPLAEVMFSSAFVHSLITVHFVLAGYLFVASLVGQDPNPHRASFPVRAGALVAALAGHSILAKYLVAHPPSGTTAAEAEVGGMLMYYGGDIADAVLIIVLCLQWYRAAGKRLTPVTARLADG